MNIEQAKRISLKDFLSELGFSHVRQRGNTIGTSLRSGTSAPLRSR